MTAPVVRLEVTPPVATVTLDRPDALNAITVQMLDELATALEAAAAHPDVQAVVLTGAGRAFSAGVDLKALGGRRLDGGSVGDLLDLPARRVIDLIGSIDRVVVAKVNGHCYTGAPAYKDLFRAAERLTLPEGLAHEAAAVYPIDDTEDRIARFR